MVLKVSSFLLILFFVSPAFGEFIPPNTYHVRKDDPNHNTINSVLDELKRKMPKPSNVYKIGVHRPEDSECSTDIATCLSDPDQCCAYMETITLDTRLPNVELVGISNTNDNKPIIDGSLGNPSRGSIKQKNVINISMLLSEAGSIHGFIIQNGITTGVKITASDVELYDNEIRNNGDYGISISYSYGPSNGPDSDGDGVEDMVDSCPDTLPGDTVNRNGCSPDQLVDNGHSIDADNDGVPDPADRCSNTPQVPSDLPPLPEGESYIPVNVHGCPYGNIYDNFIHDNARWNINVYSNGQRSDSSFATQPLIYNNTIYNSNTGIVVRNELESPGTTPNLNVRPIIFKNEFYSLMGFNGVYGTIMGGIAVTNNGYAKIIENNIRDCSRGITFNGGSGKVFMNDIHHSTDPNFGDGISVGGDSFDVEIRNNRIYANISNGIRLISIDNINIINNTIDSNKSNGILEGAFAGDLRNNIISNNKAYGFQLNLADTGLTSYNNYWGNTSGLLGGSAESGIGDLSVDPLYINSPLPGWSRSDWNSVDYHLSPLSPCINAGDPDDICDEEPPISGEPVCRINMGSYGNTSEAMSPGSGSVDFDKDGVLGSLDRCPGTLLHQETDNYGCTDIQGVGDYDRDGVINKNDECPNTLAGEEVDLKGCGDDFHEDYDGDGILNPLDRCPGGLLDGENADSHGCAPSQENQDLDGDGIQGPDDWCPGTPPGTIVGSVGCSLAKMRDSDGDGIPDLHDRCGNTLSGKIVESHGCSQSQMDMDSDGDLIENYKDECPNTPSGEPVNNATGCSIFSSVAIVQLQASVDIENSGIRLTWDSFSGSPYNFQGYYIFRSENNADSLNEISDFFVPATTPGGIIILCVLSITGFFVLRRQKGSVFFLLLCLGIAMVSYAKTSDDMWPTARVHAKIEDVNTLSYLDTDIEMGVNYYYRIYIPNPEVDYQSNIIGPFSM